MVYSMIMGDMRTFGMIYSVMLFGFSQSFYFLYKGFPGVESSLYHSYFSTWMALFQITLGDYNVSSPSVTDLPWCVSIAFPSVSLISARTESPRLIASLFSLSLACARNGPEKLAGAHLSSGSLSRISNALRGVSRHHRGIILIVTRPARAGIV